MDRIAQCQCGSLRAIAAGEPGSVYLCHCKACQRRTGTVVHTGAYYPKENVRFEGPSNIYTRVAAGRVPPRGVGAVDKWPAGATAESLA